MKPDLKFLQDGVGGYIEIVPNFDTFLIEGREFPCVAFCNEEGKLDGLPFNPLATQFWINCFNPEAINRFPDVLVGDVVVMFSDDPRELETL